MHRKILNRAATAAAGLLLCADIAAAATLELSFRDWYSGTDDGVYATVTLRFANATDNADTFTADDFVGRSWVNTQELATNATYSVGGIGEDTYPEVFGLDPTTGFTDDNYLFTGFITVNTAIPTATPTLSFRSQFIDYDAPGFSLDDRVYYWTYTSGSRWRSWYHFSPAATTLPMLVEIANFSYDATATEFAVAAAPEAAVPVPAAGGLLAAGLIGFAALRRRG